MKIVSSAMPPAPRGSGSHSVPAVTKVSRQEFESRPRGSAQPLPKVEEAAASGETRLDREPYIDAEFVEVIREAASSARAIDPASETVRLALEAYGATRLVQFTPGAMVDLAI